jgi:hypothetical protein
MYDQLLLLFAITCNWKTQFWGHFLLVWEFCFCFWYFGPWRKSSFNSRRFRLVVTSYKHSSFGRCHLVTFINENVFTRILLLSTLPRRLLEFFLITIKTVSTDYTSPCMVFSISFSHRAGRTVHLYLVSNLSKEGLIIIRRLNSAYIRESSRNIKILIFADKFVFMLIQAARLEIDPKGINSWCGSQY